MSWALWGMVFSAENWWHSLQFWMHFLKTWWLRFWKKININEKSKKKQMTWEYAATVLSFLFMRCLSCLRSMNCPHDIGFGAGLGKKHVKGHVTITFPFSYMYIKGWDGPRLLLCTSHFNLEESFCRNQIFLHRAEQTAWPFCRDFMISLCLL